MLDSFDTKNIHSTSSRSGVQLPDEGLFKIFKNYSNQLPIGIKFQLGKIYWERSVRWGNLFSNLAKKKQVFHKKKVLDSTLYNAEHESLSCFKPGILFKKKLFNYVTL